MRFFKMLIMMHCIFVQCRQNQHFRSTLFGGSEGVTKRVYAFDNVNNSGRPLRSDGNSVIDCDVATTTSQTDPRLRDAATGVVMQYRLREMMHCRIHDPHSHERRPETGPDCETAIARQLDEHRPDDRYTVIGRLKRQRVHVELAVVGRSTRGVRPTWPPLRLAGDARRRRDLEVDRRVDGDERARERSRRHVLHLDLASVVRAARVVRLLRLPEHHADGEEEEETGEED